MMAATAVPTAMAAPAAITAIGATSVAIAATATTGTETVTATAATGHPAPDAKGSRMEDIDPASWRSRCAQRMAELDADLTRSEADRLAKDVHAFERTRAMAPEAAAEFVSIEMSRPDRAPFERRAAARPQRNSACKLSAGAAPPPRPIAAVRPELGTCLADFAQAPRPRRTEHQRRRPTWPQRTNRSTCRTRPSTTTRHPAQDAVSLLTRPTTPRCKQMFETYRQLVDENADDEQRGELARHICAVLTVHAEIEEEIFYPAMRENIDADLLLDEAEVEHAAAKDLIEQIEAMDPGDALFDAKVLVLGEYIDHHVQEEENEIFPQAEKSGLDLDELGAELASRKRELMATLPTSDAAYARGDVPRQNAPSGRALRCDEPRLDLGRARGSRARRRRGRCSR